MDVHAENRGRPHQKMRFPAAPVVGRNFLTPGHSGVRVRNVRGKSGPKSLCLCCFFFPELSPWTLSDLSPLFFEHSISTTRRCANEPGARFRAPIDGKEFYKWLDWLTDPWRSPAPSAEERKRDRVRDIKSGAKSWIICYEPWKLPIPPPQIWEVEIHPPNLGGESSKNACFTVFSGAHSRNLGGEIFTPQIWGVWVFKEMQKDYPIYPEDVFSTNWLVGIFFPH